MSPITSGGPDQVRCFARAAPNCRGGIRETGCRSCGPRRAGIVGGRVCSAGSQVPDDPNRPADRPAAPTACATSWGGAVFFMRRRLGGGAAESAAAVTQRSFGGAHFAERSEGRIVVPAGGIRFGDGVADCLTKRWNGRGRDKVQVTRVRACAVQLER